MDATTNLFTDKETNNWFKASIALNVAKQGLTNFLTTELQHLHAVVGRSCGNCPIEKLIPCPTNRYCSKKKRNYCPFHKSQNPQPCPTCDNVKQKIILQHRYGGPSWRNTRAEKWTQDYWEIGKCFLPPDGYSSVSSVQELDFNGVISIMLNCLHFQTCLSSSCLSPPPPDNECPLEKVRQIGRDIRDTSDCKVTDADLQDYFQTLSLILADPICLQHDPLAMTSCTRLSNLQNDRMSVKELGEMLKEAHLTLKHAKEAGERFSEEATRTLSKAMQTFDATILFGEKCLKKKIQVGERRLKSETEVGEQRLKSKTQVREQRLEIETHAGQQRPKNKADVEQRLKSETQVRKQRLESKTEFGGKRLKRETEVGEQRLKSETHAGQQRLKSDTHVGQQRPKGDAEVGEQRLKSETYAGQQRLKIEIHAEQQRLKIETHAGQQRIKSEAEVGERRLQIETEVGEQRLKIETHAERQRLKLETHAGQQRIKSEKEVGEQRLQSETEVREQLLKREKEDGEQRLKRETEFGEHRLKRMTEVGKQRFKGEIQFAQQQLKRETEVGEQRLKSKTHARQQRPKSDAEVGQQRLKSETEVGEQRLKRETEVVAQLIESIANIREERIENKTQSGEVIESKTHIGDVRIGSKTQQGEQLIESKTHDAELYIESKKHDGTQRIECNVQNAIMCMNQASSETSQADYDRGVADLRRRLVDYYSDNASNVPLSILDQSLYKRIMDIYAAPKIHRIANDRTCVKQDKVLTYREVFYTWHKSNRRIYIQGEPGSGKSTFAAKLVHDWGNGDQPSSAASSKNSMFNDLLIIRNFKFIFFISLRDARGQTDVMHMIKKQLIDTIYSEQKRDVVYILLNQIIKKELCLVVRDGLDEWVAPDGITIVEPSMAGFPNDTCRVLTTSRSWKLADERIKNSQIDILLEIEGINDPEKFSEKILRCVLDENKDLNTTSEEFVRFVSKRGLTSLSYSPMLYTLVICTWVKKMKAKQHLSLCELWTTLLDSLCKKPYDTTGFFNYSNPPRVNCFSSTSYLRPIIQNVDVMSNAAFHLLFSPDKEPSLVFNDHTLSNYVSKSVKEFALKAGLISQRKSRNASDASIAFIHKGMQQFLAAYHIACNPHLIDDIISGYLTRHTDAYLDISQVFIFLCGLNISAANKLSEIMNEQHAGRINNAINNAIILRDSATIQNLIEAGYREAVLNEQIGILLRLSHFNIDGNNFRDIYTIWQENRSNAVVLVLDVDLETDPDIQSSPECSEPHSHACFDLSSCIHLKLLKLRGSGIHLKDSTSSVSSALPVSIVLNSADPAQCTDPPPVLPCIKRIDLDTVTCSCTWLRSLFSTLLTLDHKVKCNLSKCYITSCVEESLNDDDIQLLSQSPSSLNLSKCYITSCVEESLNDDDIQLLSQSPSSLTHMKTLSINVKDNIPGLWKALYGLNIKELSLGGDFRGLNVDDIESLSHSLLSLAHLETLSIQVNGDSPGLWKALHGLNIKELSFVDWLSGLSVDARESFSQSRLSLTHLKTLSLNMNDAESMSLSLSSLYYLETLSITVNKDSPGLWEAVCGLNIKSLSLGVKYGGVNVDHSESLSRSLASLAHLETVSITVNQDSPGLWKALCGLNIKSLSVCVKFWGLNVDQSIVSLTHRKTLSLNMNDAESMSLSLSSLAHLETLSITVNKDSPDLWKALSGLNIKSLSLGGEFGGLNVDYSESLSQSLSPRTHLENLSIGMYDESPAFEEALHGLNIKNLSVNGQFRGLIVNHADSMSLSLSSLNQLETLSIYVRKFIDIQLPQSLKYVNIYCLALLPSEFRAFVDTLSTCTQTVESKLEFGCASYENFFFQRIPSEEYIAIQQELGTLKNVAVKRFRIFNRSSKPDRFDNDAASDRSVRGVSCVDDDHQDFDNLKDDEYDRYFEVLGNHIINRISMRLRITPASNS